MKPVNDTAAWLDQVSNDGELTPLAFKLAFALGQHADPATLIAPGNVKELTKSIRSTEQVLEERLAELAARGHIVVEPPRGRALGRLRLLFKRQARSESGGDARGSVDPFPLARRRSLVLKLARHMAAKPPAAAETYLQQQLGRQIDALHRKGIADQVVEREVRAMESAVRAELWRLVLTPPGTPSGSA
jgi:hypothetical protein